MNDWDEFTMSPLTLQYIVKALTDVNRMGSFPYLGEETRNCSPVGAWIDGRLPNFQNS